MLSRQALARTIRSSTARGSSALLALRLIGEALTLAHLAAVTRLLPQTSAGTVVTFLSAGFILAQVVVLGTPQLVTREVAIAAGPTGRTVDARRALTYAWLLIAVAALVILPIASRAFVPTSTTVDAVLVWGAGALWGLAILHREAIRAAGPVLASDFGFQILRVATPLALALGYWAFGHSLTATAALLHIGLGLTLILFVNLSTLWRRPGIRPSLPSRTQARPWTLSTMAFGLSSVLRVALERGDVVLVATLIGLEEAAIYGATARLVALPGLLVEPVRAVVRPRIALLHAESRGEELARLLRTATRVPLVAALLAAALLLALPEVPSLIFGSDYAVAMGVLGPLVAARLANVAGAMGASSLNLRGDEWLHVMTTGVALIALGIPALAMRDTLTLSTFAWLVFAAWSSSTLTTFVAHRLRHGSFPV